MNDRPIDRVDLALWKTMFLNKSLVAWHCLGHMSCPTGPAKTVHNQATQHHGLLPRGLATCTGRSFQTLYFPQTSKKEARHLNFYNFITCCWNRMILSYIHALSMHPGSRLAKGFRQWLQYSHVSSFHWRIGVCIQPLSQYMLNKSVKLQQKRF